MDKQASTSSTPTKNKSSQIQIGLGLDLGLRKQQYSYSESEIVFDALQSHRDNLIKEIDETFALYANPGIHLGELQEALSSGDFVILLDQVKVLNSKIDDITRSATAALRQLQQESAN